MSTARHKMPGDTTCSRKPASMDKVDHQGEGLQTTQASVAAAALLLKHR